MANPTSTSPTTKKRRLGNRSDNGPAAGLPEPFVETVETGWWTTCLEIVPPPERARGRYHVYREAMPTGFAAEGVGWAEAPKATAIVVPAGRPPCAARSCTTSGSSAPSELAPSRAFMHAVIAITEPGDEIILPAPFYFNHEMAIQMAGCRAVAVPTDDRYQLQLDAIRGALTPRTRAIVTISPIRERVSEAVK